MSYFFHFFSLFHSLLFSFCFILSFISSLFHSLAYFLCFILFLFLSLKKKKILFSLCPLSLLFLTLLPSPFFPFFAFCFTPSHFSPSSHSLLSFHLHYPFFLFHSHFIYISHHSFSYPSPPLFSPLLWKLEISFFRGEKKKNKWFI